MPNTVEVYLPAWIVKTLGWDPEIRGIYDAICLRIMYEGKGVEDDDRLNARLCRCSVRKWRKAKEWLSDGREIKISSGRIIIDWCMEAAEAARRRDVRKEAASPSFRLSIYKASVGLCFYCEARLGPEEFELEHKLPVSRGGDNDRRNLVVSCRPCNLAKRTFTDAEFIAARAVNNG